MKLNNKIILIGLFSVLVACGGADSVPDPVSDLFSTDPSKPVRLYKVERHSPAGTLTSTEIFRYDSQGLLVSKEETDAVTNEVKQVVRYTHTGLLEDTVVYDKTSQGGPDLNLQYSHDQNGRLERINSDTNGDLIPDRYERLNYDQNNVLTRVDYYTVMSETRDSFARYYYDDNGLIISIYSSNTGETRIHENHLNEYGWLEDRDVDRNGDGRIDQKVHYVYQNGPCVVPQPTSRFQFYCPNQ